MSGAHPAGPGLAVEVRSLEETAAVAALVAARLEPGDLVVLSGPLGAGKTALTQALAAALGVTEAVTSPTFTLVRSYPTDRGFDLLHADLYRLEHLSEVADLGLAESLDAGAVAVVEWGERALAALPAGHLRVELAVTGPAARQLRLRPCGPRWERAAGDLSAALAGVAAHRVAGAS